MNPKAESVRRAAALQVSYLGRSWMTLLNRRVQVNTNGAMGLANVVKSNLGKHLFIVMSGYSIASLRSSWNIEDVG